MWSRLLTERPHTGAVAYARNLDVLCAPLLEGAASQAPTPPTSQKRTLPAEHAATPSLPSYAESKRQQTRNLQTAASLPSVPTPLPSPTTLPPKSQKASELQDVAPLPREPPPAPPPDSSPPAAHAVPATSSSGSVATCSARTGVSVEIPQPPALPQTGSLLKRRRVVPQTGSVTPQSETQPASSSPFHVEPMSTPAPVPPLSRRAACDQLGHDAAAFPFFAGRVRAACPDAALGDTAPHMFQMDVRRDGGCFLVDGRRYKRGYASGRANNCLIGALRQKLGLLTNVDGVRSQLQLEFSEPGPSQVTAAN